MEEEEAPPSHAAEPRSLRQSDDLPATASGEHANSHMQDTTPAYEPIASGKDRRLLEPNAQKVADAPPFWSRHGRSISTVSYHSINQQRLDPILLEDHSEESHEASQGCWAKSVTIDDYTILSGPSGIGAHVIWNCTVSTLKGGDMQIRKRYSEFDQLRVDLVRSFPHAEAMIPQLPRKSVVSRFRPKFLEQRKQGLGHFLNCILLNPEFAASPVLKEFIFL